MLSCMRDFTIRTEPQISMLIQAFRKARGLSQSELAEAARDQPAETCPTSSAMPKLPAPAGFSGSWQRSASSWCCATPLCP